MADKTEADKIEADKIEADEANTQLIINFLNKGLIICTTLNDLNGMLVPREIFFNDVLYKQLIHRIIQVYIQHITFQI